MFLLNMVLFLNHLIKQVYFHSAQLYQTVITDDLWYKMISKWDVDFSRCKITLKTGEWIFVVTLTRFSG